jgi:hypothetical protein
MGQLCWLTLGLRGRREPGIRRCAAPFRLRARWKPGDAGGCAPFGVGRRCRRLPLGVRRGDAPPRDPSDPGSRSGGGGICIKLRRVPRTGRRRPGRPRRRMVAGRRLLLRVARLLGIARLLLRVTGRRLLGIGLRRLGVGLWRLLRVARLGGVAGGGRRRGGRRAAGVACGEGRREEKEGLTVEVHSAMLRGFRRRASACCALDPTGYRRVSPGPGQAKSRGATLHADANREIPCESALVCDVGERQECHSLSNISPEPSTK